MFNKTIALIVLLIAAVHSASIKPVNRDEILDFLKNYCIKNAGEEKGLEAFGQFQESLQTFQVCVTDIFNKTVIQEEVSDAMMNHGGDLTPVFTKYCEKRSEAVDCAHDLYSKMSGCYGRNAQEITNLATRFVRALLNFVCEKNGVLIMSFINNNGAKCIETKMNDLHNCFIENYGEFSASSSIETGIVMNEKDCATFKTFNNCMIGHLNKCEKRDAVELFQSMLRIMKKEVDICAKMNVNDVEEELTPTEEEANEMENHENII